MGIMIEAIAVYCSCVNFVLLWLFVGLILFCKCLEYSHIAMWLYIMV